MAQEEKDYVLGTHDEEIARLGLQHAVWRPRATAAWRRAGFTAGQTLVDLGCGPGWATFDLADIVGRQGRVVAIDRSRRFLDTLERSARARGATQIEVHEQDLAAGALPVIGADGLWSRWIFAFVPGPRDLLARAVAALRPGGTFVSHEYADYRGWQIFPHSPEFESFVNEVMASWRATGGEPNIGMHLPGWLEELGVEVTSLAPLADVARPRDHVWQWPTAFIETGIARLVELGRIDAKRGRAIADAYAHMAATPHAFQITPMVMEIVGVKRDA
ncbi:MAG: methyltransferase domain-containing protein [Candidatus Eisenbacteria bacterium]